MAVFRGLGERIGHLSLGRPPHGGKQPSHRPKPNAEGLELRPLGPHGGKQPSHRPKGRKHWGLLRSEPSQEVSRGVPEASQGRGNDEFLMSNDERMTKSQIRKGAKRARRPDLVDLP